MSNLKFTYQNPSMPDPDITVTAASGPLGAQIAQYKVHRSILRAHSLYFKGALKRHASSGFIDIIPLPCLDEYIVFPYIIKFMYDKNTQWNEDKKLYICALAYRLEIPEILHIARSHLVLDSTALLVKYLNISYNTLTIDEFVSPIASVLVRRIHKPEEESNLYLLSTELFELVLKSHMLDLDHLGDLKSFVHRYMKAREKKYNEKITLKRLKTLENFAEQILRMKQVMTTFSEKFKSVNKTCVVPLKVLKDIKEQFYGELRHVRDLEYWTFQVKTELLVMKPNGIMQTQEVIDPYKSVENGLDKLEILSKSMRTRAFSADSQSTVLKSKKSLESRSLDLAAIDLKKTNKPKPLEFNSSMKAFSHAGNMESVLRDPLVPLTPKILSTRETPFFHSKSGETTPDGNKKPSSRKARIIIEKSATD